MLTQKLLEEKLAALRKQQKEASTQAVLLEGAAQFCELLLHELASATVQDTPHD